MSAFRNNSGAPCHIWYHAKAGYNWWWKKRHPLEIQVDAHDGTADQMMDTYGQLVVSTGGVTVPELGVLKYLTTGSLAQFDLNDKKGWFVLKSEQFGDPDLRQIRYRLLAYDRDNNKLCDEVLVSGNWQIEHYPQLWKVTSL